MYKASYSDCGDDWQIIIIQSDKCPIEIGTKVYEYTEKEIAT